MNDKHSYARYIWLIPLAMIILAALACDDYYVPPPMVDRVEIDAQVQGRVYTRVVNIGRTYGTDETGDVLEYVSDDYGATWQPSDHVFAEEAVNRYPMTMYGEMLELNSYGMWSFPRPMFRTVFYDSGNLPTYQQFKLPHGFVSNAAHGNTLYIAMGTEGVLVAKLGDDGFAPDWYLSSNGIDTLNPLPLTITQPATVFGIVLLILFVPPFALIHAYLLQRVWVYLLPPKEARQLALKVTAGLVVLAIIGSVFWLTNDRTDLYQVIAVCTIITVIVGLIVTVWLAQGAGVTHYTRNRLAVAAILLSLIVPGGVAAIFAMWWLVFGVVLAYWAYQRVYIYYLREQPADINDREVRWRIDRQCLEIIILITVSVMCLGAVIVFGSTFINRMALRPLDNVLVFPTAIVSLYVFYLCLRTYANRRIIPFLKDTIKYPPEVNILDLRKSLMRRLSTATMYWIILAVIATSATFLGQGWAYGWFTTLLKTSTIP